MCHRPRSRDTPRAVCSLHRANGAWGSAPSPRLQGTAKVVGFHWLCPQGGAGTPTVCGSGLDCAEATPRSGWVSTASDLHGQRPADQTVITMGSGRPGRHAGHQEQPRAWGFGRKVTGGSQGRTGYSQHIAEQGTVHRASATKDMRLGQGTRPLGGAGGQLW